MSQSQAEYVRQLLKKHCCDVLTYAQSTLEPQVKLFIDADQVNLPHADSFLSFMKEPMPEELKLGLSFCEHAVGDYLASPKVIDERVAKVICNDLDTFSKEWVTYTKEVVGKDLLSLECKLGKAEKKGVMAVLSAGYGSTKGEWIDLVLHQKCEIVQNVEDRMTAQLRGSMGSTLDATVGGSLSSSEGTLAGDPLKEEEESGKGKGPETISAVGVALASGIKRQRDITSLQRVVRSLSKQLEQARSSVSTGATATSISEAEANTVAATLGETTVASERPPSVDEGTVEQTVGELREAHKMVRRGTAERKKREKETSGRIEKLSKMLEKGKAEQDRKIGRMMRELESIKKSLSDIAAKVNDGESDDGESDASTSDSPSTDDSTSTDESEDGSDNGRLHLADASKCHTSDDRFGWSERYRG